MTSECVLAIDIGASSGRHILSWIDNGKMHLEEVYRFPNKLEEHSGHLCWNIKELFKNIVAGLSRCSEIGKIPARVGIDTWGVDFVLVDENGTTVSDPVAYRDSRTNGIPEKCAATLSEQDLYAVTGTQKQNFNTIYQLLAVKETDPEALEKARAMLMIPDYFNFLLTGKMKQEYTAASTTGLLDAGKQDWSYGIIGKLGLPERIFLPVERAGTTVGNLRPEISACCGFDTLVTLTGSHDTASAVLALPASDEMPLYISSGTWSLMGIESPEPLTDEASRRCNFTNEGGTYGSYRYLKNIMGLWMIQNIRRESGLSFGELMKLASERLDTPERVDVNDNAFLAPKNMTAAIRQKTRETMPLSEVLACVYLSLADEYARTVGELSHNCGRKFDAVHVVGGGSQDELLNQLTANACKIPVIAGPTEATSIGNIVSLMCSESIFENVAAAKACVRRSFDVRRFEVQGDVING